ncbi:alternative ribosome rescue aminoacyl-tRNA hydrolase ArfB [Bermanella sp. R86510]|uniref:alternative ribosome rescue aminoacyl-tRNA hydrolase ArfB n=1 Tax=unclassified Bermanella TaxID=2627862 RepID=UPI0037CBF43C
MLFISHNVQIPPDEIEMNAIRSQGSGGQNVNKNSTAIHLRFDIRASSLPEFYKEKLLAMSDHRLTKDGIVVIKSQENKSQELNRQVALERLVQFIRQATYVQKRRKPTKPSRSSQNKRMDKKTKHGQKKSLRGSINL